MADFDCLASRKAAGVLPTARGWVVRWGRCGEQIAAQCELLGAMAIGEEADVADTVETIGQGMLQEAADELVGRERHDLGPGVLAIVLPGEADLTVGEPHQAAVGDVNAM